MNIPFSNRGDVTIEKINLALKNQKKIRLKKILKGSTSKSLTQNNSLSANEKIVALLKEIGADEDYCGGTAIAAYMDKQLFAKNRIKITVQKWQCQEYSQLFMKQQKFIANLSILDLLMNIPSQEALTILSK